MLIYKVASSRFQRGRCESFLPPASCLGGEGGCLRPISLQTQISSRFWYVPVQVLCCRSVQCKPYGGTRFL